MPLTASVAQRTFGGTDEDLGSSIIPTLDGGYAVTGYTASFGAGDWDLYLMKLDACGQQQWFQTFGGIDQDWGVSLIQTPDSGYLVGGRTLSFGAGGQD
ncbi:MAG: hypothetical protein AAGB22_15655, partial [Bacteroidota bacterium]